MGSEKTPHYLFIFLRLRGAGGVEQDAPWLQVGSDPFQKGELQGLQGRDRGKRFPPFDLRMAPQGP
jgi:hypothetical protein